MFRVWAASFRGGGGGGGVDSAPAVRGLRPWGYLSKWSGFFGFRRKSCWNEEDIQGPPMFVGGSSVVFAASAGSCTRAAKPCT